MRATLNQNVSKALTLAAAMTAVVAVATAHLSAKTITSMDQLKVPTVVVNFEELKGKDKAVFGSSDLGQPYSQLGLVLPSQQVDVNANLGPKQEVGIRSTGVSTIDNSNYQSVAFTRPQRVVALTVRSAKATSIQVTALDRNGVVLEQAVLEPSPDAQFIGFVMVDPTITVVRVVASHSAMSDAIDSPTVVSGITFTALGQGEVPDGLAGNIAGTSDLGLAGAVAAPGAGGAGNAVASIAGGASNGGFGTGGSGNGSNNGSGRNPGNRNPNLPPAVIPEPATLTAAGLIGAAFLARRRRSESLPTSLVVA